MKPKEASQYKYLIFSDSRKQEEEHSHLIEAATKKDQLLVTNSSKLNSCCSYSYSYSQEQNT